MSNQVPPPPPRDGGGYGAPPPGPYGAPPPGPYGTPPVKPHNGKALWSMILGIASIPLVFCCYIGVPLAIAGIILSVLGKKEIDASGGLQTNAMQAKVGLITSIVALVLIVVLILLVATGVIDTTSLTQVPAP